MDRPRRSLLFTPANRPTAFQKALDCGADIVCLDLEDAVPAHEKDSVRSSAIEFLAGSGPGHVQRAIRINPLSTLMGLRDLADLAAAAPREGMVMLPKVSEGSELRLVDAVLTEAGSALEVAALIETLDGLENVTDIATATDRLALMIFGAVDFSAELGTENAEAPLSYARGRIIHAAKRAGLDVMDVPSLNFRDLDAIQHAAQRARDLGFTGKAAIHPSGIGPINATFTPSAEEVARARRGIAAYDASPNGLAVVDGQLIEAPVVKAMRRTLAIAAVCDPAETHTDG